MGKNLKIAELRNKPFLLTLGLFLLANAYSDLLLGYAKTGLILLGIAASSLVFGVSCARFFRIKKQTYNPGAFTNRPSSTGKEKTDTSIRPSEVQGVDVSVKSNTISLSKKNFVTSKPAPQPNPDGYKFPGGVTSENPNFFGRRRGRN